LNEPIRVMVMDSAAVDVLQRQVRELTTIIAGQRTMIGELTATIASQKALIGELQAVIAAQKIEIGGLKDEIALLKGLKPRPKFPPSRMEDGTDEIRKPGAKGCDSKMCVVRWRFGDRRN